MRHGARSRKKLSPGVPAVEKLGPIFFRGAPYPLFLGNRVGQFCQIFWGVGGLAENLGTIVPRGTRGAIWDRGWTNFWPPWSHLAHAWPVSGKFCYIWRYGQLSIPLGATDCPWIHRAGRSRGQERREVVHISCQGTGDMEWNVIRLRPMASGHDWTMSGRFFMHRSWSGRGPVLGEVGRHPDNDPEGASRTDWVT